MAKVEKIYVTALPMTTDEYAVGQLHTVVSMTESESDSGFKVELVENEMMMHETLGKVNKTLKVMYLKPRIPKMLHSVIPEDACVVEETSYNAYTRCHTVYKNKYFSHETFHMAFNTINRDGGDLLENPFGYESEHINEIERVHLNLHDTPVNPDFNPSIYYHEESGRGRLNDEWVGVYESRGLPIMVSYKHLTVEVNNFMMGWMSKEIEKAMRSVVTSMQQRVFCTMNEWYGKTVEDINESRNKG